MCTWNGCPHRATVTLGFGRFRSNMKLVGEGALLYADYCDAHTDTVHALYHVEHDGPAGTRVKPASERNPRKRTPGLSDRERYVLALAEAGLSIQASAAAAGVTTETIKAQRRSLRRKLGAANMTHAVALAFRADRLAAA